MKKLFQVMTLLVCVFFMSCNGPDKLSKSTIEALVTDELKKANELDQYATIQVGYYEENDKDARFKLRQLAAAGVITYNVERINTTARVKDGYKIDWDNWRYVDTYKKVLRYKYFVEVALTKLGESMTVSSIPMYVEEPDKYLITPERPEYPEDSVIMEEKFDKDGKWITAEDTQNEVPEPEQAAQEPPVAETPEPVDVPSDEPQDKPEKKMSDYEHAKSKVNTEDVYVKTLSLKVSDARNIFISKDGYAYADVVITSYDVTPFGRILKYALEGEPELLKTSLKYYQDKGWVIESLD